MNTLDRKLGFLSALPLSVVLLAAFLAPLVVVALFSIMPAKVFSLANMPDFSAYSVFFAQGYYKSVLWSLGMALAATLILLMVCWPLAYGMAKIFGRFTLVLTIAIVMSLFVSENIRLFGWVLTPWCPTTPARPLMTLAPPAGRYCGRSRFRLPRRASSWARF